MGMFLIWGAESMKRMLAERISKQSAKGNTANGNLCGITSQSNIKSVKTIKFVDINSKSSTIRSNSVNLMGNHEKALLDGDLSHFSTERGKQMLHNSCSYVHQ